MKKITTIIFYILISIGAVLVGSLISALGRELGFSPFITATVSFTPIGIVIYKISTMFKIKS